MAKAHLYGVSKDRLLRGVNRNSRRGCWGLPGARICGRLAAGGRASCNPPLDWRFCVRRLRPGRRRLYTSYEGGALRLGQAQQRPDFARTGAKRQPAGTWRAPSHGGAEATQWPAPAAAAAAHSPHLSLGQCGLGKSTLINSLFLIDLYSAEYPGPSHRIKKTVQSLQYCLGTSGNSKPRPHMKKTGKGFVTMENTCRVKASASPKGNDTAGERRRKRRTSFTRSLDHVSMPTDARKKQSMIFPNFGIFCQGELCWPPHFSLIHRALFHANKGKKKLLSTQKAEKQPLSLHLQKPSKRVGLRMHPFFYSLSKCCNGYHLSGGHKPSLKSI
nr:uncharacterized protein LOC129473123 [Symphalangus syndactylus]